ncbi:T cell activation RhoGTPase activating protein b [Scyliorhinus canicula]|uniref:T cell activation RhoGTPase activating protein b n=1 Tax=Scyliorhinus canicula TaxID=7830 RepID=UPI0018F6E907|nr:T cell activation RhoGTPase activating protein b [Scyliorhinus canicula]XP_038664136.1 T cell activation RhoGTPase activating protein b [Scyliorhinus canicula]XP_038664146.1 T cell activation RhoGTPase activating protein b [Scyliorhinus canicula]XP_038664155.1 T cell activation RhoGTPase activating protein b [Scyliorhinus canicula]
MKVLSHSALPKTLTRSNMEPATEVVKRELQESAEMGDAQNYQLVLSNSDDLSTSLIGDECPFTSEMNQLHKPARQQAKCEVLAVDLGRKPPKPSEKPRCQFPLKHLPDEVEAGLKKKSKIKTLWHLRKNSTQRESISSHNSGLFNRHLKDICDQDDTLAEPILSILTVLFKKGPSFVGIFRKSANVKACKELIGKLNAAREVTLEEEPVILLAVVLKDFLRHIPGSLLITELYDSWMAAMEKENINERTAEIKQLLTKLPSHNCLLLHYLFCVLYYINKHSEVNKMDAHNLAVCIGPNMLWPNKPVASELEIEVHARVVNLMQFLIENCCLIFGDDITTLLGRPVKGHTDNTDISSQQNDSAYDSTDQDDWKDVCDEKRRRANSSCYQPMRSNGGLRMDGKPDGQMDIEAGDCTTASCSTESMDATNRASLSPEATCLPAFMFGRYAKRINRRCSEPILGIAFSPKKINQQELLARSHDDCSIASDGLEFNHQTMQKQTSEESFARYRLSSRRPANLNVSSHSELSTASSSKASSSSSLASSYSNLSENSVFASSPLVSPTCSSQDSSAFSEYPSKHPTNSIHVPDNNVKPMKQEAKKSLKKTQSWGPTRTFSLNKGSCQENVLKESLLACETVLEDQDNVNDTGRYRTRLISVDEVFQRIDSKRRCSPPSYNKAIEENNPSVATMKGMTVKNMRRLSQLEEAKKYQHHIAAGQKNRPCSLTEELLYSPCQNNFISNSDSSDAQAQPVSQCKELHDNFENHLHCLGFEKRQYRGRAMSESASRGRCFRQNLEDYEQIWQAKESCV